MRWKWLKKRRKRLKRKMKRRVAVSVDCLHIRPMNDEKFHGSHVAAVRRQMERHVTMGVS